jgi:hypothetical protein
VVSCDERRNSGAVGGNGCDFALTAAFAPVSNDAMAEIRPHRRRSKSVLALCAALCLMALQLTFGVGVGALTGAGVATGAHGWCGTADDGGGPEQPSRGDECGGCLLCHRAPAVFGAAFFPPASTPPEPVEEAVCAFPRQAPPPERRAGRGTCSSRAPPASA